MLDKLSALLFTIENISTDITKSAKTYTDLDLPNRQEFNDLLKKTNDDFSNELINLTNLINKQILEKLISSDNKAIESPEQKDDDVSIDNESTDFVQTLLNNLDKSNSYRIENNVSKITQFTNDIKELQALEEPYTLIKKPLDDSDKRFNDNVKKKKSETIKLLNKVLKIMNLPVQRVYTNTTIQRSFINIEIDKLLDTLSMYNINQPSSKLSTSSDPNDFDISDAYKDNDQVAETINPFQQKGGGLRKRLFLNNRRIKKK
jgi:methionyl-tRNA synthetase